MKTVADWADKNNIFAYTNDMQPLGYVRCFSPTDWKVFNANGEFLAIETSKRRALNILAKH